MLILIIITIVIFIIFMKLKIKNMIYGHLNLFTGELKSGKSALSLCKARKKYKSAVLCWKIKKFIYEKILHKEYTISIINEKGDKIKIPCEMPLFYSNIPVGFDYVPLTLDLLQRKKRFRFKSVCWFDEASLFADSMSSIRCNGMSKQELDEFNKTLNVFIKLYCHETHNGYLFYNTQSLSDMHYAFKRVTNRYFYIHSCIKWVPFICIYRISELYHSEDNSSINVNLNGDILENTKLCFMSKRIWKKYDRFAYSSYTDNLECEDNIINGAELESLKADYILSIIDLPNINTTPIIERKYKKKTKINLFDLLKLKRRKIKNDKKEIK